jgi:hypothetical protein
MKTLTAKAEVERKRTSRDVFWLFDLELPDGIRRFASRPLKLGDSIYEPGLMNIKTLSQEIPEGKSRGISRIVLELVNAPSSGAERLQYIDTLSGLEGRKGTISFFFMDGAGTSGVVDIILLGDFLINEVEFSPSIARLSLVDYLSYYSEKEFCRKADIIMLPGLTPETAAEFYLPVALGKIENHPLILLPSTSALDWNTGIIGELTPEAVFATLEDVSPLPERGRVQIGDEAMEYRFVDRVNGRIGSEGSPLIRPEAGYHADGATVRFLPEGGLYYLVADHSCKSVSQISSNGRLLNHDEFTILEQMLGEGEVCEVRLERYPCLVQNASGVSVLRMDGLRSPGSFQVKEGGTALFPERAIDSFPGVTSAILDESHPDLILQFNEDLSNGIRSYGNLVRCWIEVSCLSSPKPGNRSPLQLEVTKGVLNQTMDIHWPQNETLKAAIPRQDLLVSGILDSGVVSSLVFPENSLMVRFDEVFGEEDLGGGNYKWKDSHLAKDDNFNFYTENFTGPGISSNTQPLEFKICRRPMMDEASRPARALFHAVMDSHGTSPKNVKMEMRLADRFNGSGSFYVDGLKKEYIYEVPLQNINFEHLVDSATHFTIEVPDGSALRVYETWLEIGYSLNPPEIDPEKVLELQGMEGELSGIEISLPTPMMSYDMDITGLVKTNNCWGFFTGADDAPLIFISFSGGEESVHITNVSLVLEYRPRVKEIQTSNLAATVEGIHENGSVLQNPADLVRYILTDKNFLDFSESSIDEVSFERVKTFLSNRNQIYQECYSKKITVGGALDEIMRDCGIRLICEGGKFRLLPPLWNPCRIGESLETVEVIDEKLLLDAEPGLKKDAGSPMQRIELLTPLEAIRLERGDRISLSHERAMMDRAWGEIIGWEAKTLDQIGMELAPLETGIIFWERDESSLLRQISGGKGIVFYVNKIAVARLEACGDLFLMGELWEESLGEEVLSSMIEFEETGLKILFGAGQEEAFTSIFALDQNGCLLTRGEAVEGVLPFSPVPGDFAKSLSVGGEDYIILSADCRTPLLIGERSTGKIYLRGEIRENEK